MTELMGLTAGISQPPAAWPGVFGRGARSTRNDAPSTRHVVQVVARVVNHAAPVIAVADPDVAAGPLQQHPGEGRRSPAALAANSVSFSLFTVERRSLCHLATSAPTRRDVARDLLDAPLDHALEVRTVPRRVHSCGITSPAWIWVVETTALDVARHDRLQRRHDVTAHHHRIDTAPWYCTSKTVIGRDGRRSGLHVVHAGTGPRPGTCRTARRGRALVLLGRLDDEGDAQSSARYLAAPSSITVWPSWPQACILPGIDCRDLVGLVHIECVHVGAQADRALPNAARPPLGEAAMYFHTEGFQVLSDDVGGPSSLRAPLWWRQAVMSLWNEEAIRLMTGIENMVGS